MNDESKRPPHVYSGAWWESLSPDDLKAQKDGSFPGGKAYDGAVAEIDRRAKLRKERQEFWFKVAGLILAGVGAIVAGVKVFSS